MAGVFALNAGGARTHAVHAWEQDASWQARIAAWQRILPTAFHSVWLGTGLGTFPWIEPLSHEPLCPPPDGRPVLWEHAHNDYVEALVEGGVLRLLVSLLAIGLVFRMGIRAYRRSDGVAANLFLGAIVAFATVVVHSFVDFGLHVPAIVILTTVVAAHICAHDAPAVAPATPFLVHWGARLSAALGAAALACLALALVHEAWRTEQAERWRLSADRVVGAPDSRGGAQRRAFLEAALRLTPEDPALHLDLAEAWFAYFQEVRGRRGLALECAQAVLSVSAAAGAGLGSTCLAAAQGAAAQQVAPSMREEDLVRRALMPALQHYLLARDACPLLSVPQARLAAWRGELSDGDPPLDYLRRAMRLRPDDAELWYIAGAMELREGNRERAWFSWRHVLTCSPRRLDDILRQSAGLLAPADLAARVLPDDPSLLCDAAARLDRGSHTSPRVRILLEKALALLQPAGARTRAPDWHLRGLIEGSLEHGEAALTAYETALDLEPGRDDWRCEFAELLRHQGRELRARDELRMILAQQPGHARARALLQAEAEPLPAIP
jgi:hypothetical protein